jgi:hypothetical protein
MENKSRNNQNTGNIGLFYVCYRLSKLGWNVMPTSRNAKGVDIIIYSDDAKLKYAIQVKTLGGRVPVPLGDKLDKLFGDYLIICRNVSGDAPECFVLTPPEIHQLHFKSADGKSFWLQPKAYAVDKYLEKWSRIRRPNRLK